MNIGVVGTFIRDRIFPIKEPETSSFGGVFFTVSFLANLAERDAQICPVAYVGADFYDELTRELARYDNIRLDGLIKVDRENTQVQLHYTRPQERYEITTKPMSPLDVHALDPLRDADAILVNLITGEDLQLEALREFRQHSTALIYLDFHSHALGIDTEGRRFYRRPDDWREWIHLVDVLQLNEMEARTLAGVAGERTDNDLLAFGRKILNDRPSICHLTLAERGSYLFYEEESQVRIDQVEAHTVDQVVDIIGCGDAFAAGYIVHYLKTKDISEATKFANRVAAVNCTFMGSSGVRQIRDAAWRM